jgi:hypothetical protein
MRGQQVANVIAVVTPVGAQALGLHAGQQGLGAVIAFTAGQDAA